MNKSSYYGYNTSPISAKEFYKYIFNNFPKAFDGGSDPKIVAEVILSQMKKEITRNFKYITSYNISKIDEVLYFKDIYKFYKSNKNIVTSNFYWIQERKCTYSECKKST